MVALSCNLNCKPLSAFVWLSKGIEAVYFKIARGHRMLRIVCSDSFDVDCVNLNLKKRFRRLAEIDSSRCGFMQRTWTTLKRPNHEFRFSAVRFAYQPPDLQQKASFGALPVRNLNFRDSKFSFRNGNHRVSFI